MEPAPSSPLSLDSPAGSDDSSEPSAAEDDSLGPLADSLPADSAPDRRALDANRSVERRAAIDAPASEPPVFAPRAERAEPAARLAPVAPPEPAPRPEPEPQPTVRQYGSCEAAIASANDEIDMRRGGARVPDLPTEAFSRVLDNGAYLSGCGIPETMAVNICAAIRQGRAVGVTITTQPASARVRRCVASAVRRLSFPAHPRLDVARTRFDAVR